MFDVEIEIVDEDGAAIEAVVRVADIELSVITNVRMDHNTLVLYDFHIEGAGANTLGMTMIRRIVSRVMEREDVEYIEIRGFRRTTGANPGRVPRPLKFTRR
jgi:hypothetical protein